MLPGAYIIRMVVNGRTLAQGLTVKMDPRVKATAADLKLQYDTSRAIDAMLRRAATALREIRAAARTPATSDLEQRLSRASAPLGQLFSAVESTDAAPMPIVLEEWKRVSGAVAPLLAEWDKAKAGPR